MRRLVWVGILALILGASGCGESKEIVEDYAEGVMVRAPNSANRAKVEMDLRQIRASVELFYTQEGRYPSSLQELTTKGAFPRIPREASGGEWVYDSMTGKVSSSSHPEL